MRISLSRKKQPIELETEDGSVVTFEIREMDGLSGAEYKNKLKSKIKVTADGQSEISSFTGLYSDLLSRCLFDAVGNPVPAETIEKWPESALSQLFEVAQEVNGLNKESDPKKD